MRIKKLILHGFKSFADRTEFGFEKGITVIVGPNGCGKSNIVDAVKWVLGEQRPTSLRGKEMQDVIFSGTDSRKGVGFAEVSLVFDNTDGVLPIEYDEVSVSRRLYRSGESEYEINGNAVRLRDVRELMMDSGGGPGAFSVMEQGNIDRLLRADPLERRQVFEEAAGIAKYRARRSETGRKLDRTKENLDRLRDLMGEYETRERSLKIQAGKARRFEEFTEELKKKRVASALARYADLARRQEETQRELEAIAQAERDARDKLEEGMTQSSERRREQDAFRDRVSKGETEIARLVGEDRASAEKKAARQRESDELEVRADEAEREGAEAARRARDLEIDLERAREESDDAGSARDARNDALSAAEALLAEVEARLELMRQESETLDLKRTEAFAQETEARNAEVSGQAEFRALNNRLERLAERARASERALKSLDAACDESRLQLKSAEERFRALEERFIAAEQEVRQAQEEREKATQDAAHCAGEAAALEARRDLLARLVAEGEGLGSGTKALLEAGHAGTLDGVRGLLAELLGDVGSQAAVLDTALGDLGGAIVVETTPQALAALAWLKRGHRGRARVIPLDRLQEGAPPLEGKLAELQLENDMRRLLAKLLVSTRVAVDLGEALRIHRLGSRVVTLDGEEVAPDCSLWGGSGGAGAGFVLRNAELAQIKKRLDEASRAKDAASGRATEARRRAAEWDGTIASLRPRLKQNQGEVRVAGEKLAAAAKAVASRREEYALEAAERGEVEHLVAEQRGELAVNRSQREKAEAARTDLERESTELAGRIRQAEDARQEAASRETEAKVEAARWMEKAEAAAQRCRVLEASISNSKRESDTREAEVRRCRSRRAECLDEIEALARFEEERGRVMQRLTKEVEELRRRAAEIRADVEESDQQLSALRLLHEERREELEQHRLKASEYRLRIESLLDQVRRDQGLELTEKDVTEGAEAQDPGALEQEITELRDKIERLGNVNHAALDELTTVKEKLEFYRKEEGDLTSAEKQLRETIERIDEICRTRFTATFEQVRDNFRTVFRKLFGGGKAEIILEEPDDVLTSGIQIAVRPPGKELRNMALLSGGEKSLTTVALLFSIYQTKPPPFCLLDEVDAALDESNTVRLCEMLKDFATRGQFLIITHARPTMTVADTLYGVTMPEAGVSRQVAVRFADIEAGRVVGLN